jgi:hypothetical protein
VSETSDTTRSVRPDDVPRQADELYSAELDGETVIFSEITGELTLLDEVGTVIWSLLDGVSSVEQISLELSEAFGAPAERVRQDVAAMLSNLVGMQLVALASEADS